MTDDKWEMKRVGVSACRRVGVWACGRVLSVLSVQLRDQMGLMRLMGPMGQPH
jgi:hypothetical protein